MVENGNKMIKVYGGTNPDKRLCDTCSFSLIMVDQNSNETIVCGRFGKVKNKIIKCSGYVQSSATSLRSMEDIAWILVTNKTRRKVGFYPGKELKEKNYGILPSINDPIETD